jgi:hypothetical protein
MIGRWEIILPLNFKESFIINKELVAIPPKILQRCFYTLTLVKGASKLFVSLMHSDVISINDSNNIPKLINVVSWFILITPVTLKLFRFICLRSQTNWPSNHFCR